MSNTDLANTDVLEVIKKVGAVRKFSDKQISEQETLKIAEAGIWGLSILGMQPWKLVFVKNVRTIKEMSEILMSRSREIEMPFQGVLKLASDAVGSAMLLAVVYNTNKVVERTKKYGEPYISRAKIAEWQCIGGVIQNMIMEAYTLGVKSVWLDSPTFFDGNRINDLLGQKQELCAVLAFGYSDVVIKRSKRADYGKMVQIIE